jgi:hypothetical protein
VFGTTLAYVLLGVEKSRVLEINVKLRMSEYEIVKFRAANVGVESEPRESDAWMNDEAV